MGFLLKACAHVGGRGVHSMDSERLATDSQLPPVVLPDDSDMPAGMLVWEEPGFEVIEVGAEVTAYAYRR
jgi:coenzyme PQQ precursor peptide PqqA